MKNLKFNYGSNYGLAIQLTKDVVKNYKTPLNVDIDLTRKYHKNNDVAIVVFHGGPLFSRNWTIKFKKWTIDLFNLNNDSIKKPDADIYLGVCSTWKGILFDEIYKKSKKISGVEECNNLAFIKKPNPDDLVFVENFLEKSKYETGEKVLKSQNFIFRNLAKNLKQIGYKKVYYVCHSWAGGLVNSWINVDGNKVFDNIDKIFSIASKFYEGAKDKDFLQEFAIPFYLYNDATDKYDIVHKQSLTKNAIVIDTFISSFFAISLYYNNFWEKLSIKNRKKYYGVYTDYDFRMGSFEFDDEKIEKIALSGINIIKVDNDDLTNYKSTYLKSHNTNFVIKHMRKFGLVDTSFHNTLLNYFVNNYNELYLSISSEKNLTPKKQTLFSLI